MAPTLVPSSQRVNFAPSLVNTSERLAKDLERASTLATLYEKDLGDARGSVVIEEKRLALLAEANLSSDDKGEAKDNLVCIASFSLTDARAETYSFAQEQNDSRLVYCLPAISVQYLLLLRSDSRLPGRVESFVCSTRSSSGHQERGSTFDLRFVLASFFLSTSLADSFFTGVDARWETKFEEKIKLLLGKDINPVEHGGESYDELSLLFLPVNT